MNLTAEQVDNIINHPPYSNNNPPTIKSSFGRLTLPWRYNPKPKPMSRRDRIRAGLQKRNQTSDNVIKNL